MDASRLAALAALIQSCGYFLLGSLSGGSGYLPHVAALLIGLGWGMFYIGGPMALSERLTDTERGPGFTRFSAFQMTGICGSPILLTIAVVQGGIPIQAAFLLVGVMGVFASILLMIFGTREPLIRHENSLRPWVKNYRTRQKRSHQTHRDGLFRGGRFFWNDVVSGLAHRRFIGQRQYFLPCMPLPPWFHACYLHTNYQAGPVPHS